MFDLIEKFQKQGVLFCAASGRRYNSLRGLFAPMTDDLLYACENSAVFFSKGEVLGKTCIPHKDVLTICRSILDQPNCEVLISGERTSYLLPKSDDYVDHIRYFVGNHVTLGPPPEAIPEEDILKVSAFCRDGAVNYEESLGSMWKARMNVAVSSRCWLDFTVAGKEECLGNHSSGAWHFPGGDGQFWRQLQRCRDASIHRKVLCHGVGTGCGETDSQRRLSDGGVNTDTALR